jgi:hypothetical protein
VNVEDAFDKIFKAIRNKSLPVSLTELMWSSFQAQTACPLGCICDEQEKWKTEELLLNHLQLVEIIGLRGSQYEVSFVKQVFNWAKALKRMKLTFSSSMSENMAKELSQVFQSFSRPEICMEFYLQKDMIKVLYALQN